MRSQVAGLLVREGKVLLCLRSATRSYFPGVWDLPGGHVEPGESEGAALRRELEEELGIVVLDALRPPLARIVDAVQGFDLQLWIVDKWRGSPRNLLPAEHDSIGWFSFEEARGLPLALPDYQQLIRRAVAPSA